MNHRKMEMAHFLALQALIVALLQPGKDRRAIDALVRRTIKDLRTQLKPFVRLIVRRKRQNAFAGKPRNHGIEVDKQLAEMHRSAIQVIQKFWTDLAPDSD